MTIYFGHSALCRAGEPGCFQRVPVPFSDGHDDNPAPGIFESPGLYAYGESTDSKFWLRATQSQSSFEPVVTWADLSSASFDAGPADAYIAVQHIDSFDPGVKSGTLTWSERMQEFFSKPVTVQLQSAVEPPAPPGVTAEEVEDLLRRYWGDRSRQDVNDRQGRSGPA